MTLSEFVVLDSWADQTPVIQINPDRLRKIVSKYYAEGFTHLSTIIAYETDEFIILDYPLNQAEETGSEIKRMFLEVQLDKNNLNLDSLIDILPSAVIYEQEVQEAFGIKFYLNNDKLNLYLPSNIPKDLYPMRKQISISDLKADLDRLQTTFTPENTCGMTENYTMAIGPQHPTHKEPIRFEFYIKGEDIKNVGLQLGFNYRGIEKALEVGNWVQNLYLIERICGICSSAHQIAYVTTAEKIMNIVDEIPEKAHWMRSLIAELERIHSHMLWYGVLAHDGGFDMMFHVSWRDREIVMDILEQISGNRVNYSIETIGGVRRDLDAETRRKILYKLLQLKDKIQSHQEILEKETTFLARLENIGTLSHQDALKFNIVGPTARASGVNFDLRKEIPYAAYKDIPFKKYIETSGDLYATLLIRMQETLESVEMCIYILLNFPSGEIAIPFKNRVPEGKAHTRVEAPRGENVHFIYSKGGKSPDRHKIRAPTLANISSLLNRFNGMQVADIPMIIRLIDPCIGCMERVSFIDVSTNKVKEMTGNELTSRSIKSRKDKTPFKVFG